MPPVTSPAHPFGTVLTAMVTPMTGSGVVDLDAAVRLAVHLVDHGHDGLVLNGTTGEAPTTHAPEKADLIRAVVAAVGDRAVIVAGAGSNDTAHAVRMAEGAAEAGAHGLLVVTPYYNRPSQEGLYQHFSAVAGATDLPVMLYDIPGRTGLAIGEETLDRLAANPRIVAVKDATGKVADGLARMRSTGLVWYSGDDALNMDFLRGGAAGVVSVVGHVAGERWARVSSLVAAGDLDEAQRVFDATSGAIEAIMGGGQGAVMAKAAVQLLGLAPTRQVRLPLVAASDAEVAVLRSALVTTGLLEAS